MRPARRLHPARSILTALVLIVGMVATQTREAAMVHVRCVAHGELVHVNAPERASIGHNAKNVLSSRTGDVAFDHEHCVLVGTSACVPIAITAALTMSLSALPPPLLPAPATYVARATFRIAPKNSPPA
ncbi:MAG: hypothetical protein ABI467_23005 [Kofleriaceae bacterium]